MTDTSAFPFRVVSAGTAEAGDFVVCCRDDMPSRFNDNEAGVCAHCSHGIFFRPYMPKKPTKICVQCMLDVLRGGKA